MKRPLASRTGAAVAGTIEFVRTRSRPWIDSGKDRAADDSLTVTAVGDLVLRLHATEALLERAGRAIDAALSDPNDSTVNAASLATSEAKVLSWRNARTLTLHDPVRGKYFHIGNLHLNGVAPPRHPWN